MDTPTKTSTGPIRLALALPRHADASNHVAMRRAQLEAHDEHKKLLEALFRECASGGIRSDEFYDGLSCFWAYDLGNRLQYAGWERRGKVADFTELSKCFVRILDSSEGMLDVKVSREFDKLEATGNTARGAFFTEMLCLLHPEKFPILNGPVKKYLKDVGYKAPRGKSAGDKYIHLSETLRASVEHAVAHPMKTVAELDYVLWLVYDKK